MKESKSVIKDPVCGMTVNAATALYTEKDGKKFYFCSDDCKKKFMSKGDSTKSGGKSDCCCG
ncbi:MAG: YHS domain-containing protein [Candidatus Omnitrophica bacterium]|nr:YHS domain-containing protein [Candidatus Omnitrophota bacterium]